MSEIDWNGVRIHRNARAAMADTTLTIAFDLSATILKNSELRGARPRPVTKFEGYAEKIVDILDNSAYFSDSVYQFDWTEPCKKVSVNGYMNMARVSVLLLTTAAYIGHAVNITVSDASKSLPGRAVSSSVWQVSNSTWPEVTQPEMHGGPSSVGNRLWQLEAMTFQIKNGTPWLFLVGGYDFQNKGAVNSVYGPNLYGGGKPGDLFIWYSSGTAHANHGLDTAGAVGNAGLDYAYAVSISDFITGGNLTVYDLNEDTLIDPTRGDGPYWNPWRVKPLKKGVVVDENFVTPAEYYVGQTSAEASQITGEDYTNRDTGFGLASSKHRHKSKGGANSTFNVLAIDLSFLSEKTTSADAIWFQFTNQRGEPVLVGAMPGGLPVADGGLTAALLGFSFFVLTRKFLRPTRRSHTDCDSGANSGVRQRRK